MSIDTRSRTPLVPSHVAVPSPVASPQEAGSPRVYRERVTSAPPSPRSAWPADDVFDAGMDSFPASDPPSWGPLRVGAPSAR
jgi:hypothetical protein